VQTSQRENEPALLIIRGCSEHRRLHRTGARAAVLQHHEDCLHGKRLSRFLKASVRLSRSMKCGVLPLTNLTCHQPQVPNNSPALGKTWIGGVANQGPLREAKLKFMIISLVSCRVMAIQLRSVPVSIITELFPQPNQKEVRYTHAARACKCTYLATHFLAPMSFRTYNRGWLAVLICSST
jgi:hypothetical protein